MKRPLLIVAILFVMLLSACSKSPTNSITRVELNDREETILAITSNDAFVFDYNVVTEYKEVIVWVEKYEFGQLTDGRLGYITTDSQNNGSIILTTSQISNQPNKQVFNIGISHENAIASTSFTDSDSYNSDGFMSNSGSISEEKYIEEGEILLANLTLSKNANGVSSLSPSFYNDPRDHLSEIEEYEVVYLLKAEFSK